MAENRFVVFLDRDGTLIQTDVVSGTPTAITRREQMVLVGGAVRACASLKAAGFSLVLVTNQPDVARGLTRQREVDDVNQTLVELLDLDFALTSFHDDSDGCDCRKPLPGLLTQGASLLGIPLNRRSFIIGDRWRDVGAGTAVGLTTVFLDLGYAEDLRSPADHTTCNINDAARWILTRHEEWSEL